jgi:hypothetical protein
LPVAPEGRDQTATTPRQPAEEESTCRQGNLAIGVLPEKPVADPSRELPSLSGGERLCNAFELYRQLVLKPQITLDQLVLLVSALARRDEVALGIAIHVTARC